MRTTALIGFEPYIQATLPSSFKPARRPNGPAYDKLLSKFIKFIRQGYFSFPKPHKIKNLIDYFYVAKGEDDIRPVFNGTSCGLTDAIW